jgi:hypothetical protein
MALIKNYFRLTLLNEKLEHFRLCSVECDWMEKLNLLKIAANLANSLSFSRLFLYSIMKLNELCIIHLCILHSPFLKTLMKDFLHLLKTLIGRITAKNVISSL